MTLISDIGFCAQTVTIEPQSAVDKSAKPTYGTAVTYSARIQIREEYRMNAHGDVVHSKGRVYLTPVVGASMPRTGIDRLTLPVNVYLVTQPPIVDVEPKIDEVGATDHIVVYFM